MLGISKKVGVGKTHNPSNGNVEKLDRERRAGGSAGPPAVARPAAPCIPAPPRVPGSEPLPGISAS